MSAADARNALFEFMHISKFLEEWKIDRGAIEISRQTIGETPAANVYSGFYNQNNNTRRKVAIKCLRAIVDDKLKLQKRLVRELTVWSRLHHENIGTFCGLVEVERQLTCGVVSTFIEDKVLEYVYSNPSQKLRVVKEITKGIQYLHADSYIIHGDIKPDNILVTSDGTAKIIDFGLSRLNGRKGFTTTTVMMLNPRYAAHELIDINTETGPRPTFQSDIFSLGMTMLEILNNIPGESFPYNHLPRQNLESGILLAIQRNGELPRRDGYPTVTQEQWNLLQRCWMKNPQKRCRIGEIVNSF